MLYKLQFCGTIQCRTAQSSVDRSFLCQQKKTITNVLWIKSLVFVKDVVLFIPQEILQELENNKLTNEKVYDTKILLPKDKKGFFYKGKVNINNVPYGYGVLLRHDGMKAEGNWNNYILTGWSRLIEVDGTLSEGFFIKNKLQGKGIQKTLNGVMYIGTFVNGIKEGEGVEESNEYKYEGMFQNGKKNGLGRIEYKILQDVYEGESEKYNLN